MRARTLMAAPFVFAAVAMPWQHPHPTRCAEDAPCWTWSAMGNHARGIVLRDGSRAIVTARGYCAQARMIDHTRTPHLKGDPAC